MALVPIHGRPGRFLDTETNKLVLFCDAREDGRHFFPCDACDKDFPTRGLVYGADRETVFCSETCRDAGPRKR